MRRKDKELNRQSAMDVLTSGSHGVLAMAVEGNGVYAIPMSYAVEGMSIYFHGARDGRKVEIARNNPRATLVTVTKDQVVPEKFSTNFESAIAEGILRIVEDESERLKGFRALVRRYSPDFIEAGDRYIEKDGSKTLLFALDIEQVYGKRSKE